MALMTLPLLCASLMVLYVDARPDGAPIAACDDLVPSHPAQAIDPAANPPDFLLYSSLIDEDNGMYIAGKSYTITLAAIHDRVFRGFVIQAQESGAFIGSFTSTDMNVRVLDCPQNDDDSTITHTNNVDKTSVTAEWTAPMDANGTVTFRYSIVTGFNDDWYANLNASNFRPGCPLPPTAVGDHNIIVGLPDGCERESCTYYVGIAPNEFDPSLVDIYLEGNADGWVAIGFSQNMMMALTDVLGCRVDGSDIDVLDSWNPTPNRSPNMRDDSDEGLCTHYASFDNGRIRCQFSRTANITDIEEDFDLNDDYYLVYGIRTTEQTGGDNLGIHTGVPTFSAMQFNPLVDNNTGAGVVINCPPTPDDDLPYTFEFTMSGYTVRARVNADDNQFLDVFLEGDADGWVGIGFSENRIMEEDDVLACIRDASDDSVAVIDAYNPEGQYTPNTRDPDQAGVCPYTTSFSGGTITCRFSRFIAGTGDRDRNLDEDHFLLFATSNEPGSAIGSLPRHSTTPVISSDQANIVQDTGVGTFPTLELQKVHGILMIVAWPLLVVTAIFFAAWMKPALPNGEWFQFHRAFMIFSVFINALGIIFIFVANATNEATAPGLISFACGDNTAHFIIGWIVFLLQIANPLIALCRCKPTDDKRWIFNISHGTIIGFSAEILALINVGLGIALFETGGCPADRAASNYTILWVYVAFVAFLLAFQVVLFVVFTLVALNTPIEKRKALAPSLMKYFIHVDTPQTTKMEMTAPSADKGKDAPPERKPASSDAPARWLFFAIFGIVTFILMLVIIILVAIQ